MIYLVRLSKNLHTVQLAGIFSSNFLCNVSSRSGAQTTLLPGHAAKIGARPQLPGKRRYVLALFVLCADLSCVFHLGARRFETLGLSLRLAC